jgi:hypothetical protein
MLLGLEQWVPWRNQPYSVQFGGETVFVAGSGCVGKTLTQFRYFFCARAAAADFRATARCGHDFLLGIFVIRSRYPITFTSSKLQFIETSII